MELVVRNERVRGELSIRNISDTLPACFVTEISRETVEPFERVVWKFAAGLVLYRDVYADDIIVRNASNVGNRVRQWT